jgi:hypothetical protein
MTIEFNCPKCGALIAFDSKYAGKRARCLTCQQKFIIPAESFQKPKKVEEPKPKAEPIPGFYRAVFVESWPVFVNPKNVTTLTFIVAVVCFRFFLARAWCCGFPARFIIWGWLFGFYGNLICRVAFDDDVLPEIDLGTSITWLWYVIQPFLVFFYTLFLVELPFVIALSLTRQPGVLETMVSDFTAGPLHLQILFLLGLFVFPAAILTTSVGHDLALLRPDYLLVPIVRAFLPYATTVLLIAVACLFQSRVSPYTGAATFITVRDLALNLLVQSIAIVAMRAVGLLYRHYHAYFQW